MGLIVARKYELGSGVPDTFFIGRDWVVKAAVLGEMDDARIATGIAAVKK